jgi:anti-sigma factor RsiW
MWINRFLAPPLCKHVTKVSVYIDHEMSLPEREVFEQHLKNCSICQAECEEIRFAKNMMQRLQLQGGPVQVGVTSRIQSLTSTKPGFRGLLHRTVSLPVPVAAVLAVLLLLPTLFVWKSSKQLPAVTKETVEVQVPVERLVTQTVYVQSPAPKNPRGVKRQIVRRPNGAKPSRPPTIDSLDGFRPADTANLRVIKGNAP